MSGQAGDAPGDARRPESTLDAAAVGAASDATRFLRIAALAGFAIHLVQGLVRSFPLEGGQIWSLVLMVALLVAAAAIAVTVLATSVRLLVSNADLLVPVGLYFLASDILGWVMRLPVLETVFSPSLSFSVLSVAYSLGLGTVIGFVFDTVVAGWIVLMALEVARERTPDLVATFRDLPRWFIPIAVVRLMVVVLICALVTIGVGFLGLLLPLGIAAGLIAVVTLGPVLVLFNMACFFPFPCVLERSGSFAHRLGRGFRLGVRRWRALLVPLVLVMLVLGSVPYFTFSSSASSWSVNMKFHVKWIADFPISSSWEGVLASAIGVDTLPLVTATLGVACFLLGIALTIELYRRVGIGRDDGA